MIWPQKCGDSAEGKDLGNGTCGLMGLNGAGLELVSAKSRLAQMMMYGRKNDDTLASHEWG